MKYRMLKFACVLAVLSLTLQSCTQDQQIATLQGTVDDLRILVDAGTEADNAAAALLVGLEAERDKITEPDGREVATAAIESVESFVSDGRALLTIMKQKLAGTEQTLAGLKAGDAAETQAGIQAILSGISPYAGLAGTIIFAGLNLYNKSRAKRGFKAIDGAKDASGVLDFNKPATKKVLDMMGPAAKRLVAEARGERLASPI